MFAAGRQLTWYTNPGGSFTSIRIGEVNAVRYHPNAACGTKDVRVQNKATAALYYYTPYTPNAAALNNLYGTGDACSAYGNRNFWRMYNDWFGSPTDTVRNNPIGNVELVEPKPGVFRVAGWAMDPDTSASLSIHVYVGSVSSAHPANLPRDDVAAAYGNGRLHGFDVSVPAQGEGNTSICVYAINVGPGGNLLLGCFPRTAKSGSPVGALTEVKTTTSGIQAIGWSLDPDTVEPSTIHIYVDSVSAAYTANAASTAIPGQYSEYGTKHGFSQTVPAAPGAHTVCVYGINSGPGGHVQLGCMQVVVPDPSGLSEKGRAPVGNLEVIKGGVGQVEVSGWAIDPDTAASIQVHVYVDSFSMAVVANGERPDLAAVYPANGTKHGFGATMPASPGTHTVCAYGINTAAGGNSLLGCRVVQVTAPIVEKGRVPIGYLEGVSVDATGVTASGWAIDPDTAASIQVHVYVDSFSVATTASLDRADVGAAYPGYGAAHGYSQQVPAAPGPHSVCAYGINTGPGGPALLGCTTVIVPGHYINDLGRAPFGGLEAAIAKPGAIDVGGWAIDPDTSAPIAVHVYVDSFSVGITANLARTDVGNVYPAYGPTHGFWTTVTTTAGTHNVCAYAINNGAGGNVLLGCTTVTVP
ncbi:hypothetical protein DCE93_09765 [Agromyces badenianii]|uniref:Uncharacterized protein n=1 Tax=Agromyces badenianii TaxID=2080742 RepID=A0A2S0WXI4_9MICO|nr:hypothetical protein DCE93_09765 [Agromyces badenianii]